MLTRLTTSTFTDRASMDKAMGRTDDRHANRQGSPFRRHERHWMETDDEQDQRVATSPDGKMDAWVEGYNVVVHQVGRPYSEACPHAGWHDRTLLQQQSALESRL